MISALSWVPKGSMKRVPAAHDPHPEEVEAARARALAEAAEGSGAADALAADPAFASLRAVAKQALWDLRSVCAHLSASERLKERLQLQFAAPGVRRSQPATGRTALPPCAQMAYRTPVSAHVVHIEPAPIFAHKAAARVLAHGAPAHPVARHELHLGRVRSGQGMFTDLQAQPLDAGLQLELRRSCAGMPARQKVIQPCQHKGAVARSHQALRGGGGLTRQKRPTALSQGQHPAAHIGTAAGAISLGGHVA